MYTTGDKLLNVMKEEEIGIAELARISGVQERTILDIMAGVKEPELGVMCKMQRDLASVSMSFVQMRRVMRYPFRRIALPS